MCIVTVMAADDPVPEPAAVATTSDAAAGAEGADAKDSDSKVEAKGGWTYNYAKKGQDWGSLVSSVNAVNYCGEKTN